MVKLNRALRLLLFGMFTVKLSVFIHPGGTGGGFVILVRILKTVDSPGSKSDLDGCSDTIKYLAPEPVRWTISGEL